MTRRMELVAGVASGIIGFALLLFALFGSTGTVETTEVRSNGTRVTTTESTTIWEDNRDSAPLLVFTAVMAVSLASVAIGAWAHAWSGSKAGYALLVVSTGALGLGTLLSLLSVGLFFLPSLILAIVACLAGSARWGQERAGDPSSA